MNPAAFGGTTAKSGGKSAAANGVEQIKRIANDLFMTDLVNVQQVSILRFAHAGNGRRARNEDLFIASAESRSTSAAPAVSERRAAARYAEFHTNPPLHRRWR
jgi:hypothetical protein